RQSARRGPAQGWAGWLVSAPATHTAEYVWRQVPPPVLPLPAAPPPMARETPARLVAIRPLLVGAALALVLARDQPGGRQHAADGGVDVLDLVSRRMFHQPFGLAGKCLQHLVGRALLRQLLQA